jgi:DNA-binding NarL/FixJ family response regulator
MIRIFIADDHAIVRQGLKQIVSETADLFVTGEAGDGTEALKKIRENDYDVVVLDITMPGRDGLEILKQIKNEKPRVQVLILSMHPEEQYALRVLKAGASGYLTKESAPEELTSAIRTVSKGRQYISTSLAERLACYLRNDTEKLPHERLSDREYQVMILIASGKTIKEIAIELCLSVKTISTYKCRILEKMHLNKNAELTHYALRHDLIG